MNVAFTVLLFASLAALVVKAPAMAFSTLIDGASAAIVLAVKLLAIYAVWLSVLKMLEQSGLDKKFSRLVSPVVRRLFKGESDDAYNYISINLASNMLGMGGAATLAGINAMQKMETSSTTDNMRLLVVINATSIQLIPATVIAIRAAAGSKNAADIFLPTLLSTAVSTLSGIVICKLIAFFKNKKHARNATLTPTFDKIKPLF